MNLLERLFGHTSKQYDGQHWNLGDGCPDCGGTEIYEGPCGGGAMNICCGNLKCRSAFNDLLPGFLQRIPNTYFRSAFPENPTESEGYLRATNAVSK
jgi:hypothetical protein